MKKTILIDGQMFQTNAWHRGMGMYVRSLFGELLARKDAPAVSIILNSKLPHDDQRLQEIRIAFPQTQLFTIDLPIDPQPGGGDDYKAIATLDAFIDQEFSIARHNIHYFIPALFLFDYAAVFPTGVKKILLFHDLTPLIFREDLALYFPNHLYFPRFATIFDADVIFANSQTTANDLTRYLGIAPQKIATIDGSLSSVFLEEDLRQGEKILNRLHIQKGQFVLLPTGTTAHKNNIRAAQAFMQVKRGTPSGLKLVTTSFYRDFEKEDLRLIAGDDIIFTGNATNAEMSALFSHCAAVLFPSLYEGLGLPVLEGIIYNKPVVCSDASVFLEIPHCQQALYIFHRYDVADLATQLLNALAGVDFDTKKSFYPAILKKYNWKRSGNLFVDALESPEYQEPKVTHRVAVLAPDPRRDHNVGRFIQRLAGYGQQHGVEFVYFLDPGGKDEPGEHFWPDYVRAIAPTYDINEIYARMAAQSFKAVLQFPSTQPRFRALTRACLSVPGFVYIASADYSQAIMALGQQGLISPQQLQAEESLAAYAREHDQLQGLSLLGDAHGVIVEEPQQAIVERTLKNLKAAIPFLTIPPAEAVTQAPNSLKMQSKIYGQICNFVKGKHE